MKELYNIKEASALLKISISSLYRLTSKQEIPFYKIGARVVFSEDQLTAWLEKHVVNSIAS